MGAAVKRKSPQAWSEGQDQISDQPTPKRARHSSTPSDLNTPSPPQVSSLISSPLLPSPQINGLALHPEAPPLDRPPSEDSEAETEALSGVHDDSQPPSPEPELPQSSVRSSLSPRPQEVATSAVSSPAAEPIDPPSPTPVPSIREEEMGATDDHIATKNEEEAAKKTSAVSSLEGIEKHFAVFRDRIYEERQAELDAELAALNAETPIHSDYLAQKVCIDQRLRDTCGVLNTRLRLDTDFMQLQAIADWTIAHSQYFQEVREIRQETLKSCADQYHKIQQDPKHEKAVPDYILAFPTERTEQIQQQRAYNKEVSILSGFATFVGFPAAPSLEGLKPAAREEDLKTMRILPKVPQLTKHHSSPAPRYTVPTAAKQAAAEDATFYEQNPWAANPQRRSSLAHVARRATPTLISPSASAAVSVAMNQHRPPSRVKGGRSPMSIATANSLLGVGTVTGGAAGGVGGAPVVGGAQVTPTVPKRRNYVDLINQSMPTPGTPVGARLLGLSSPPVGGGPGVPGMVGSGPVLGVGRQGIVGDPERLLATHHTL